MSSQQVGAVTKAINLGNKLFLGSKKKKKRPQAGGSMGESLMAPASIPSQMGMVRSQNNSAVKPYTMNYLVGRFEQAGFITFWLNPFGQLRNKDNASSFTWDPATILAAGSYREYRIKGVFVKFLGSAPSTNPGSIYIGGAKDPTCPSPELDEFTLLERSYVGPVWQPTAGEIQMPCDSDWRTIDSNISPSDLSAIRLFSSGVLFLQTDANTADLKLNIRIEFDFRGKNPVVNTSTNTIFVGDSVIALAQSQQVFSLGSPQNWTSSAAVATSGSFTGEGLVSGYLPPGYYVFESLSYQPGSGSTNYQVPVVGTVNNGVFNGNSAFYVDASGFNNNGTDGYCFIRGLVRINIGDTLVYGIDDGGTFGPAVRLSINLTRLAQQAMANVALELGDTSPIPNPENS
jgi:hypothetical protein